MPPSSPPNTSGTPASFADHSTAAQRKATPPSGLLSDAAHVDRLLTPAQGPSSSDLNAPAPAASAQGSTGEKPLLHSTSPLTRTSDSFKRARRTSPSSSGSSVDLASSTVEDSSEANWRAGTPDPTGAPTSGLPLLPERSRSPLRLRFRSILPHKTSAGSLSGDAATFQSLKLRESMGSSNEDGDRGAASSSPNDINMFDARQADGHDSSLTAPTPIVDKPATVPRPPLDSQLQKVEQANHIPLQVGDTWYLVSTTWFNQWKQGGEATGKGSKRDIMQTSSPPTEYSQPIDCSDLLDLQTQGLKMNLMEGADYELVSAEAWELLASWYGVHGPVFARKVIPGMRVGAERIEFRPPKVLLVPVADQNLSQITPLALKSVSITISVSATLSEFKAQARDALRLPTTLTNDAMRFWRLPGDPQQSGTQLQALPPAKLKEQGMELVDEMIGGVTTDSQLTLESLQLDLPLMSLAVEVRSETGKWPSEEQDATAASAATIGGKGFFASNTEDHWSKIQGKQPQNLSASSGALPSSSQATSTFGGRITRSQTTLERQATTRARGLVGLQNLGNTCFMNSALQCMSNTVELQQYFVSGVYKQELNSDNPLGMGGALAEAFGNLLEKIWGPNAHGAVVPREFKYAVSRFAPQFAGYGQQDTQELLAFLLDGLHEDLNRILKKPYIEAPDWEGGGEKEMVEFARKQWEIYKARNDSVIVDLFQGQYKSTLVCPKCSKVSIKFDPFMYLTLPIPNRKIWSGEIVFVPYDTSKAPVKVELALPQDSTFTRVKSKLGELFGVDPERLVGGEIWHSNIHKWYHDWEAVTEIGRQDTAYFWELPTEFHFPPVKGQSLYSRSSLQHPEVYEKANTPPADEDWAVVIVFAQIDDQPNRRRVRTSAMGVPFFVAIPPEKKNDPEAIRSLVDQHFSRFAQEPKEFQAQVRSRRPVNGEASHGSADTMATVPLASQPAESNSVTEIIFHEGEQEPEVVESSQPDEDMVESALQSRPALHGVAETAPSEASQSHSSAYTLHFAARKLVAPLPQSPENWDDESEELTKRADRLRTDAGARDAWPLLYTGGALICIWDAEAAQSLLVQDWANDQWGTYESLKDDSVAQAKDRSSAKRKVSIEDCLDEFTKKEQLGSDDLWYCPACKEFRQATKKFDLWKVPDILVVHLKRFSSGRYSRDKLDDFVDFPVENFDLSQRVEGSKVVHRLEKMGYELPVSTSRAHTPEIGADANDDAVAVDAPIYDLYAVDNHYGGLGGGHYTAYAKNHQDGNWYYYDDSSVRKVEAESCKTSAAYLLFYRRRTARHIGGKTRQKLDESLSSLPDKDAEGDSGAKGSDYPQPPGGFPEADASEDPWDQPDDGYGFNAPQNHLHDNDSQDSLPAYSNRSYRVELPSEDSTLDDSPLDFDSSDSDKESTRLEPSDDDEAGSETDRSPLNSSASHHQNEPWLSWGSHALNSSARERPPLSSDPFWPGGHGRGPGLQV